MPINKFHEVAIFGDDNRRGPPGMLKDGLIVGTPQAEFPHMARLDVKPVSQVSRQPRRQLRIDNEPHATSRAWLAR